MWAAVAAAIAAATGEPFAVEHSTALSGGCIHNAYRVEGRARVYFVKLGTPDKRETFAAEAAALEEIGHTHTVRVPAVIGYGSEGAASWLVTEYLTLRPHGDFRALGQQLAALHRVTAAAFGWWRDNTIGATPQHNAQSDNWIKFWREQRLGFQFECAARSGYGGELQRSGERLLAALDDLLRDHRPQPALLHGDLWPGNIAFDRQGAPVLFDPASYYGDREADVAMTELFGRLPQAFYAAYHEAHPLEEGYAARKDLYNLYPVLNHLNLFGAAYLAQAQRLIAQLLRRA